MAFLRASFTSLPRPSAPTAPCVSASFASGALHSGQRLAKPGLSGFNSNSSEHTTQTLIGKAITHLFYDFLSSRSNGRGRAPRPLPAQHFILKEKTDFRFCR